ncbi:MAG: YceI family protein [Chitinophagales bacterium]|nr:YceI family protein [Chitinophagales bacterium]
MKSYLLIAFSVWALAAAAQAPDRYKNAFVCTTGKVHFFSKTPVEDIEATTTAASCVVNTDTRKVSARIPIITFRFEKKLMEQHFNENYMETDKYPHATFDGEIINTDIDFTKDGTYDVQLKGILEIHGVKKERVLPGKITIKNGEVHSATTAFDVRLADHNIQIPKIVFANIAEVIKVDGEFVFQRYRKTN